MYRTVQKFNIIELNTRLVSVDDIQHSNDWGSYKFYMKTQFKPHREHAPSPL